MPDAMQMKVTNLLAHSDALMELAREYGTDHEIPVRETVRLLTSAAASLRYAHEKLTRRAAATTVICDACSKRDDRDDSDVRWEDANICTACSRDLLADASRGSAHAEGVPK